MSITIGTRRCFIFVLLLTLASPGPRTHADAPLAPAALMPLVDEGAVLLRAPTGEDLVRINPERPLIPASLIKIALAQVALEALGEDFRFTTDFYHNAAGDLLIRGYGDPFLVSEEVALIAAALHAQGLREVRRLVVDDSAFAADLRLPGQASSAQPYAAINGALVVNFNTVNLAWTSAGQLISGETQTPLTAQARALAAGLQPGAPQRINLGEDASSGLRQVQQLFTLLLEQAGIHVAEQRFHQQSLSEDWQLYYRHYSSRSLHDNLEGVLHYSNNFIANQLYLGLGAQLQGYPATAEAALAAFRQHLQAIYGEGYGEQAGRLLVTEGAGLDRAQRSSATAMLHMLEHFLPHAALLPEEGGVLRKSGTLTGVYNFAGYIPGADGLYPFVIMTNQAGNRRAEILALLQAVVAGR